MSQSTSKSIQADDHRQAGGSASRRTVLKAGAAAAVGLGVLKFGVAAAQEATPAATTATGACVLTAELTEGPYYVASELVRQDITEGKAGVPVKLRIAVEDLASCGPLANAAVDIWHCDAQGYYSGITGENPGGGGVATGAENANTTYLRGVQLTGADGVVEFDTIFPGWYSSRTVHIHMKVHVDGAAVAATATPVTGETYQGGHVSHTGQLFFTDALAAQIFATEAYARASQDGHIENANDNFLAGHEEEPGFLVTATPVNAGSLTDGIAGTITVTVDSTVTQTSSGGFGGQGGPPPSGGQDGPPTDATPAATT